MLPFPHRGGRTRDPGPQVPDEINAHAVLRAHCLRLTGTSARAIRLRVRGM